MWQIVNSGNAQVLADNTNGLTIYSSFYDRALRLNGITIAASDKTLFNGRRVINYNDPDFTNAFRDYYFPNVLQKIGYVIHEVIPRQT
ncbi:MAG: hypothetical protein H0V82_11705 [Candidatus Protochlamydia sp.]|nr:hypothetical protein [Candidatus Protochlamydia sp.]